MKNFLLISYCLLFIFSIPANAQISIIKQSEEQKTTKSYPIDGTPLLWKEDEAVRKYLIENPNIIEKMKLMKPNSWDFNVGTQKSWYSIDFSTNLYTRYQVQSTCRAVGEKCYIFVEDSLWGSRVNQTAVDSVRIAFDQKTPANQSKGIYQTVVETFGNPPDVDNDPRIIILILNIRDGYDGTGGYIAGYFLSNNEISGSQSNMAEIYFLDANPTNLISSSGLKSAMSTTAHEFQHMVHWNYKRGSEITFINEGCSLVSEVICGYPIFDQSGFVNETNHYLFDWRTNDNDNVLKDQSRAARFFTYLNDQFTANIFHYIVQDPYIGIDGLNDAFQKVGSSLKFEDVFKNWAIANILDDRSINSAYGYIYPGLLKANGTLQVNPNIQLTNGMVERIATQYITYKYGSNMKATFNSENSSVAIKVVKKGTGTQKVEDVTPNIELSIPDYGTTYNEIDFLVINTDQNNQRTYSYQSAGSSAVTELKWEDTEPTGYYSLSQQDTVCVTFDAVPGANLDSIRIALRRAGSITGGVWTYTGSTPRPTPLGTPLAVPITATSTISPEPPIPYPVPWSNWVTVDLRSYNISANLPFVVGFVIGSDYRVPGVMATKYPGTSPYHSYVYLNSPSSGGQPNWYYLTVSTDSIAIWLIRAYVSFGLSLDKNSLTFTAVKNGDLPVNQTFKISNTTGSSLNWSISKNQNWLNVNPMSGKDSGTITVSVNTTNLDVGTYSDVISVIFSGSTKTINVSYMVNQPATVYPGDANNDGIVDVRDILPIGMYFGKIGPVRQNSSLNWIGQEFKPTQNWDPPEACYADCDGNGTINEKDVQGIIQNWFYTHSGPNLAATNRTQICNDLLKEIEKQPSSNSMDKIRTSILIYMKDNLGVILKYALEQNYPNPFNPSTMIQFTIPENLKEVRLTIYNVLGEIVWERILKDIASGNHEILWSGEGLNGSKICSGVYFYKLQAGSYTNLKQMILIK
jgi:hypothetical protein